MFCDQGDCPLNGINITPETVGAPLILGFVTGRHQENVIFTPSQLQDIYNEVLFMVRRYHEHKKDTLAYYGEEGSEESQLQLDTSNGQQQSLNVTGQSEDPFETYFKRCERSGHNTNPSGDLSPAGDELIMASPETTPPPEQKPLVYYHQLPPPATHHLNGHHHPQQQHYVGQPEPLEWNEPQREEQRQQLYIPSDYPYLKISFQEILSQSGFIGLRKTESMTKLSAVVSRPLGCCYDEKRRTWAIADSDNNRVVLYPDGITIESPQFKNPATVCVVEAGRRIAVLSDQCLATYDYDSKEVAIVVESTSKLRCRGLARTPRGNLVTVVNRFTGGADVLVYDMSSTENYGDELAKIALPGSKSPSFCAMNGSRLVISDLGNQSLFMLTFADDERSAQIQHTQPNKWHDSSEPNGAFDFVSGVQIDPYGWVLVADAGGHSVQLFDANLNFMTRVGSDFNMPYMSSICMNNSGQMMMLGRKNNDISVAQLEAFSSLPPLRGGAPRRDMRPAAPSSSSMPPAASTSRSFTGFGGPRDTASLNSTASSASYSTTSNGFGSGTTTPFGRPFK